MAGCALAALSIRVIGISADESSAVLERDVRSIIEGIPRLLDVPSDRLADARVEVDDRFVGGGYGVPTPASREAIELCARTEALFLDPTYTSKAMAGLIARVRSGEFDADRHGAFLAHRWPGRTFRMTSITFLGAAQTVTGSKYLLDTGQSKVLIDAGLFQGLKELRERNWQNLPDPARRRSMRSCSRTRIWITAAICRA